MRAPHVFVHRGLTSGARAREELPGISLPRLRAAAHDLQRLRPGPSVLPGRGVPSGGAALLAAASGGALPADASREAQACGAATGVAAATADGIERVRTAALALWPTISHAILIDRGEFSFDTATRLQWLKLGTLLGYSYDEVSAGALGYTTSEWRYATQSEVVDLFTRYIGAQNDTYTNWSSGPSAVSSEYFEGAYDLVTCASPSPPSTSSIHRALSC